MSVAVLEKLAAGGQMVETPQIDNYPGYTDGVDGYTLGQQMREHAEKFGATTRYAEVTGLELNGAVKTVETTQGAYRGKTVVIATGAKAKQLGVPGEQELQGRGVHYCATCDAMFYRGKTVVVVGGGNSAAAAARVLSRLSKKVILVHRREALRAGKAEQAALDQVEFRFNSRVVKLLHDGRLHGVLLQNVLTGEEEELPCDGLFVSVGQDPNTELFRGQVEMDPQGFILAGEDTRTSIPGVFAAGDLRVKSLRQVVTATADGAVAATAAEEYITKNMA